MTKELIQLLICFILLTACNQPTKKENTSPTSGDKIVMLKKSVSEPIKKDSATLAYIHANQEYVA